MKTISWILLTLVGLLLLLGSGASLAVAYFAAPATDVITPNVTLEDLNPGQEVADALRGRRGTAASFGLGFTALFLMLVLGPYRRGDTWAWWAILVGSGALCAGILLRYVALTQAQGGSTGVLVLVVVGVALLLDVKRLTR